MPKTATKEFAKWRTVTIPTDLHRKLKTRAKQEGRKVRFIVERMLTLALREPPRAL